MRCFKPNIISAYNSISLTDIIVSTIFRLTFIVISYIGLFYYLFYIRMASYIFVILGLAVLTCLLFILEIKNNKICDIIQKFIYRCSVLSILSLCLTVTVII